MSQTKTRQELVSKIQSQFGDRISEVDLDCLEPYVRLEPRDWLEVARYLRDECGLDYLACLTSVDRGPDEGLEAVYNLERMDAARLGISIRIKVPREDPVIPSVERIWRTADWHEREAWDLMGIRFEGHHNLVRILCAEDWEGHPLRKDYRSPDHYHGVKNNVV